MKRFAYRAYYQYNGPSLSDPLREEKSADEVTDALRQFPIDLEYLLSEGATLELPEQRDANYSVVVVVTPADKETTNAAVSGCLSGLDLYGDRGVDCPHCGSARGGWIRPPRREYTCEECGTVHRAAK